MTDNSSEDVAQVKELLSETYANFVTTQNSEGFSSMYSGDVLVAHPKFEETSKEGIKNAIQAIFDKHTFKMKVHADELAIYGDFAYVVGKIDEVVTPRDGSDSFPVRARILWLLRKEGSEWKIFRQICAYPPI